MLEAIASGKPVVTHLWIESCGQANCFIDERNYILRDAKKEKEFGFSMPVSLARASRHPLLEVNICRTRQMKGSNIDHWIMYELSLGRIGSNLFDLYKWSQLK